jgi:hypothetical protein
MFFLYGESLIYYFKHIIFVDEYLLVFAIHHRFISAVLYLIGTTHLYSVRTHACRIRVFRDDLDTWVICISVYTVLLDPYDPITGRLPGTFHCQLNLRRIDLVLPAGMSSHHKRYIRIHLRHAMGKDPPYPTISQEDGRGLHRRMDLHHRHRWRNRILPLTVQIHDLSRHCNLPLRLRSHNNRISGFQHGQV